MKIIKIPKFSFYLCTIFLIQMVNHGSCDLASFHVGHKLSLAVPSEYSDGFIGRAFLMDDDAKQVEPNFRVALSAEANKGKYSCSLEVFLGDFKVLNSGHYSQFYTTDSCVLELSEDGDLLLKGPKDRVGWRTGTSGQGVERLQILKTGNLVLVDVLNQIKWQSFNFPTDVMLWGPRLDVSTRLTSFPSNSSSFYSFEILHNKIALYLNSGKLKYSYWEFKPPKSQNISFIELGSKELVIFNDEHEKMAQIPSIQPLRLRFLALGNETGNLGFYFHSPKTQKFEASFQADQVEMLELNGVNTVLIDATKRVVVSKTACANLCLDDCECVAALYSSEKKAKNFRECSIYNLVVGIIQVEPRIGVSYMIKVSKGTRYDRGKASVKKWVLIVVGIADGLVVILVFGGVAYHLVQQRRKKLIGTNNNNT